MSDVWTFGNRSNSYFQGNDVVLYQNGDEVGRFNRKDNLPGVEVKCHNFGSGFKLPNDVVEEIWDATAEMWWDISAQDVAQDCGYEHAYSAGRSGGWCCPSPADADAIERYLQCHAAGEDADEYDVHEAEKFFSFCVLIKQAVKDGEDEFENRCKDMEKERIASLNKHVAREDLQDARV